MARAITDMAAGAGSAGRRLLWFVALYAASIAAVFAVAGLLKAVLPH